MPILFKFRSLGDDESLERALGILRSGRFWCARLWDLNDPMEGVYFSENEITRERQQQIFSVKNDVRICCFSGRRAFKRPSMWGYYANGFKGIAIEVRVSPSEVTKITYSKNVADLLDNQANFGELRPILTTKLKSWSTENEYRYFAYDDEPLQRIGSIEAVHFAFPYDNVENQQDVKHNCNDLNEYLDRRRRLTDISRDLGIPTYGARISGNQVVSQLDAPADLL